MHWVILQTFHFWSRSSRTYQKVWFSPSFLIKIPVLASSFSFHNCLEEDLLDAFPSIWSWIKSTYLELQDLSRHANFLPGALRELKCLFEKTFFSPNNWNNFDSFLKLAGRRHRQERFFYKPFTTSTYFYGTFVYSSHLQMASVINFLVFYISLYVYINYQKKWNLFVPHCWINLLIKPNSVTQI